MAQRSEKMYQCPGDSYTISAAVHYGRMARYYAACRQCPHRDDTGTLSTKQVAQLKQTQRRPVVANFWHNEGLAGVVASEVDARVVRRTAFAVGLQLREAAQSSDWPTVVVGGDGRSLCAEWMEAACEGLRYAGCHVIHMGCATAASLAVAIHQSSANGGILIGNALGQPHTASVKFWVEGDKPISAPGGLDRLRSIYDAHIVRPVRRWGTLLRRRYEDVYLATLKPYFHALRPLRVLLDTCCQPLKQYLHALSGEVGCTFIEPARSKPACDLAVSIDGDGEACWLRDECRKLAPGDHLVALLARHLLAEQPGAIAVLERESSDQVRAAIRLAGGSVVTSGRSREEMYLIMRDTGAIIGGGPSGRVWYAGGAAADALRTLALLLVILSQSDRPLSLVVQQAIAVND